MDSSLLNILRCPACGGELKLLGAVFVDISYKDRLCREVETGQASCDCGRSYPISEFVISFAQIFSPILQREADYWEQYYLWLRTQGSLGFHDLDLGTAPYIASGVAEHFPEAATLPHYTVHKEVADHPLLRSGHTVLDIGVGLGWTSLHLARSGYKVTAIDPALGSVQAAKRYSIEQGVYLEYICASLGTVDFRAASFDNVTAFHALHHEPDLEGTLIKVRSWLRPGGTLALDEHVGNSRMAASLWRQMSSWAEREVFPQYRTLGAEELSRLPAEPHSPLEDSNTTEIVPIISRLFDVQSVHYRHVMFDHYPLLYYLKHGRNIEAFGHAMSIAKQMQEWLCAVDTEHGDYVVVIARSRATEVGTAATEDEANRIGEHSQPTVQATQDISKMERHRSVAELGPAGVVSAQQLTELVWRVGELESHLREQGDWARSLEKQVLLKNAALARLRTKRTGGLSILMRKSRRLFDLLKQKLARRS